MSVCPGCGRCRTCGHPPPFVVYPQIPFIPYTPQPPAVHPGTAIPWTTPKPYICNTGGGIYQ